MGVATSALGAAISLWRGHYWSAGLSVIGIVPAVGSAANALKITKLGTKAAARLAKATAALGRASKAAQAVAQAKKLVLIERAAKGGLGAKLALGAYDFVFYKALRLACFTAGTADSAGECFRCVLTTDSQVCTKRPKEVHWRSRK